LEDDGIIEKVYYLTSGGKLNNPNFDYEKFENYFTEEVKKKS
jgi:hypothetical protein